MQLDFVNRVCQYILGIYVLSVINLALPDRRKFHLYMYASGIEKRDASMVVSEMAAGLDALRSQRNII